MYVQSYANIYGFGKSSAKALGHGRKFAGTAAGTGGKLKHLKNTQSLLEEVKSKHKNTLCKNLIFPK